MASARAIATRCCWPPDSRAELYQLIGYQDFEELDASIVRTIVPHQG
jgi:hypothetical protein